MKYRGPKPFLLAAALFCDMASHVQAQGAAFQNLDFEAANIPPGTAPGTFLSPSQGIPGWSSSTGSAVYEGVSLGGDLVSISDSVTPYPAFSPLEGYYSVVLFGGEN